MSETNTGLDSIKIILPNKKDWRLILMVSFLSIVIYQGIIHLSPYNRAWLSDGSFSWLNFLTFFFIDQILIETISVFIIILGLERYSPFMNLGKVDLKLRSMLLFFLKFVPLFLLIYFGFAPFTTSIRFLFHQAPVFDFTTYFNDYFFLNKNIYLAYLFPTFLIGYGLLIRGLVLGKINREKGNKGPAYEVVLIKNQQGEKYVPINDLVIITRKDRKYWVRTRDGETYSINLNLSKLEAMLPEQLFVRINRATIIQIELINTFSYWEHQKYILKTKQGEEFIISRDRMKLIKSKILNTPD